MIKENAKEIEYLRTVLNSIADTLLTMESGRINEASEITDIVQDLNVSCCIKNMIQALKILKNENLTRDTYGNDSVVEFCNVIRNSYPLPNYTAEQLIQ